MQDLRYGFPRTLLLETVWKVLSSVLVTYALLYGEQEIPY
jgi:hypothetical protein